MRPALHLAPAPRRANARPDLAGTVLPKFDPENLDPQVRAHMARVVRRAGVGIHRTAPREVGAFFALLAEVFFGKGKAAVSPAADQKGNPNAETEPIR